MDKILLIEDDDLSRFTIRKYLLSAGYEVVEATDGVEGCRLEVEQEFDLIITDIVMQKKDGIATIIDIKERSPKRSIIAITGGGFEGYGKTTYSEAAEEFGADYVLKKPFTQHEFLSCVEESLSFAAT